MPVEMDTGLYIGLAEVAIVFAGFCGISVVLGRRGPERWSPLEIARLRMMVEVSVVVALFALLPIVLDGLAVGDRATWTLSSACLAAYYTGVIARSLPRALQGYRKEPSEREHLAWLIASFGGTAVVIIVLSLNAAHIGFPDQSGAYFLGLVFGLAMTARLFLRSLSLLRGDG